jgi:hypothetical protein
MGSWEAEEEKKDDNVSDSVETDNEPTDNNSYYLAVQNLINF